MRCHGTKCLLLTVLFPQLDKTFTFVCYVLFSNYQPFQEAEGYFGRSLWKAGPGENGEPGELLSPSPSACCF